MIFCAAWAAILLVGVGNARALDDGSLSFEDPEVQLGDRLFFETRFAQFYHARAAGDSNAILPRGDPLMEKVPVDLGEDLPGPFAGQGINCRQCHLGSDFLGANQYAGRTYGDFSRRSPIPTREDGQTRTPRNSPLMIDLGLPREAPLLLHFDGEFVTHQDVILDTLTGRNMGWLPGEREVAVKHIAKIIREDRGMNPRYIRDGEGKGIPYAAAFAGTDQTALKKKIPRRYRIDVTTASDEEVLAAAAELIHAYMDSLRFGTKNTLRDSASPYDLFLTKNDLPRSPDPGESTAAYADRLLREIESRDGFHFVTSADDQFALHRQPFSFGARETEGLKVFLRRSSKRKTQGVGNCVACHPPPRFTDFGLHNTGVSQAEYDSLFGAGAFSSLSIPDLAQRQQNFDAYLPPNERNPRATGRFRAAPDKARPGYTDLGVWNVFANPAMPKPQKALLEILCARQAPGESCAPADLLPKTVGLFKTPSVRDLGQSEPYFHTGEVDTIELVIDFYHRVADQARAGRVRNGAAQLKQIRLSERDRETLAAFLRSLNEDYR